MLIFPLRELLGPEFQDLGRFLVQGNNATGSRFGLRLADADCAPFQVRLVPAQQPQLGIPHAGVESEQHGRLKVRPEPMPAKDASDSPDFEVDSFGSRLVLQALMLVAADVIRVDVGQVTG